MKPIKLTLASVMVVAAATVYAQDSIFSMPPLLVQPQDQTTPQHQLQQEQINFKKDMVVIQPSEIPASLRNTLQGSQYKGWESGVIYRNQNSDMYMVEMRDGNQTSIYRFDQNGKAIKDF